MTYLVKNHSQPLKPKWSLFPTQWCSTIHKQRTNWIHNYMHVRHLHKNPSLCRQLWPCRDNTHPIPNTAEHLHTLFWLLRVGLHYIVWNRTTLSEICEFFRHVYANYLVNTGDQNQQNHLNKFSNQSAHWLTNNSQQWQLLLLAQGIYPITIISSQARWSEDVLKQTTGKVDVTSNLIRNSIHQPKTTVH
jgi:hypothetical protein